MQRICRYEYEIGERTDSSLLTMFAGLQSSPALCCARLMLSSLGAYLGTAFLGEFLFLLCDSWNCHRSGVEVYTRQCIRVE